jgi:hypothetical protein
MTGEPLGGHAADPPLLYSRSIPARPAWIGGTVKLAIHNLKLAWLMLALMSLGYMHTAAEPSASYQELN